MRIDTDHGGLLVDLYHIDSAYVSWRTGHNPDVTFDLYARRHPFGGSFLLTAGLELAIDVVRKFRMTESDLSYLRTVRAYPPDFLTQLGRTRFTGTILAIPEGEIAFANEPMARVSGPFQEAILLESVLLHLIGVSTLIATKAARVVRAAEGRDVSEFGFRRAQAPYLAARAAYLGGCGSTSFVDAARRFGVPTSGTIPHAIVELFDTEEEAFRAVAETLERYTLLLDTYDVLAGADNAIRVAHEAQERWGHQLTAVRLDSGDLAADAYRVRRMFDGAGLADVRILVSGDLDEWKVADLVATGAPIDGFGAGTSLATGAGTNAMPGEGTALAGVFKLVWVEGGRPPIKIAGEKSTWPGKKQVVRIGNFARDIIQLDDEPVGAGGRPLLQTVIDRGDMASGGSYPLEEARARAREQLSRFPDRFQQLDRPDEYPVLRSDRVIALQHRAIDTIEQSQSG
ncbi:nicotinate phosphoribosyltransferase [soil metagenome]